MNDVILNIEEAVFTDPRIDDDGSVFRGGYEGYIITTSKQKIYLGICNNQQCCESFGYFLSEDNTSEFINSELYKIDIVDSYLKSEQFVKVHEGETMFVNLYTSNGILQFVAYNAHNGYYSHTAIAFSETLDYSVSL